jgi:hypothetical protein
LREDARRSDRGGMIVTRSLLTKTFPLTRGANRDVARRDTARRDTARRGDGMAESTMRNSFCMENIASNLAPIHVEIVVCSQTEFVVKGN